VGVTAPSSIASWYVHGPWTQVLIKQLVVRQEDSEREVRGPPASKAFDAEGKPTKVI
jgi:glycyl-tRNA synthetase beta subunit